MSKPKITFESWTAMSDDIATLAECERKRMSVPWRIWEICLARANNWGHAAFRPGELAQLVCGGNSRTDIQTVNRGMKRLAEMGRIMAPVKNGSTQLCVVVNREVTQRQAGKGGRLHLCSEPEHREHREDTWPPEVTSDKPKPAEAEKPAETTAHLKNPNGPSDCPACKELVQDDTKDVDINTIHRRAITESLRQITG
jgi:hypothetical protein